MRPQTPIESLTRSAARFQVTPHGTITVWRRWGDEPSQAVLLHGGSGSWRHWCANIDALTRTHTVWVPDIAGFGESSLPAGPLSMASLAQELCDGLEQISGGFDEPLDVIGFSLGAAIAAQFASAWQGSVRNLVVVGCNVSGRGSTRAPGLLSPRKIADPAQRRQAYRHNLALMMFADASKIDETILDVYIEDSEKRTMPFGAMDADDSPFARLGDLPLAGGVSSISGETDPFVPGPEQQRHALSKLRPGSAHHVVPNAAHWVMYESAPAFNQLVGRILAP